MALVSLSLSAPALSAGESRFVYEMAAALSGPCCGDSGHDVAVDPDGSFFIVGNYGALDLDGDGAIDLRSEGGHDAIIMKGRASGDLAWVRAPRSPAMSFARLTVALDRRGGAYMAGGFRDSMTFRSGARITARGDMDGLLVRYNAVGEPLWAHAIGGDQIDVLVDAATDAAGNVYVTGTMQGAFDVDSDGRTDANTKAGKGLLVASYDPGGKLRWFKVAASGSDITAGAIAVTAEGEVHVAAHYLGADVDLDGDARADLPAPGKDGAPVLVHFDAEGGVRKVVGIGQAGNGRIDAMAVAVNGDLLVTGWSQGTVDLNGDGKPDVTPSGVKQTPYVARYSRQSGPVWVRVFEPGQRLAIMDLASSKEHIAISGLYRGPLDLDGDGSLDGKGDADGKSEGLVAILENDGTTHRIFSVTGPGADQARAISFAPDGRSLWMTGFVRLTADFDGDGIPEGAVRCDHYGDIVWARYGLRPQRESSGEQAFSYDLLSTESTSRARHSRDTIRTPRHTQPSRHTPQHDAVRIGSFPPMRTMACKKRTREPLPQSNPRSSTAGW